MLRRFIFLPVLAASVFAQNTPPPAKPPVARAATPARSQAPAIVQQWMRTMTLRDRIAQLISMACYGEAPATRSTEYQRFRHWVQDLRIGALIVNNRVVQGQVRNAEPYAVATFLNRMQRISRIPLLVQGDFERGPSMRVANTVRFPYNMAYGAAGDLEATKYEGAETARQARALGFHWIFAPDADVNNNPNNPIINIRSYGEDPKLVADHVGAYIDGAHSDPKNMVLVSAKHFPGHGDTDVDSHIGLGKVTASRERMDAVEWVPFRAAIEHGVDSIMTAHLAVPAIEPEEIPATLSKNVITGVLQEELGFKGIVITDAMDMKGLSSLFGPGEASVRALEAGVDMLLMPTDPDLAIKAVLAAVKDGRLTRQRIDRSVIKILSAKVRLGLARQRLVNVELLGDAIDNTDAEERAQGVANHAVTLVKDAGGQVPFTDPKQSCAVVLMENRYSQQGRQFITELRQGAQGIKIRILDPTSSSADIADTAVMARDCKAIAVAAFVTVSAYRGNVALPGEFPALIQSLVDTQVPVTLIAFGNPYLLRAFPSVSGYLATYSTTPNSEAAAAKALLGEIPIRGRMPVTIPGYAQIGDGISKETKKQ